MNKNSTVKLQSGNKMPVFGLGTWRLNIDTAQTVLYALKLGFRLIDTSSDYETQPGIGEALEKSGINRKEIYLTTKVEEYDNSYERTKSNLEELQLDYADLMLIHRPPPEGAGEDLWQGLIKAKKKGLVKDIGVSNYSSELIDQLISTSGETPAVNQIEWSPFGFIEEMKDYCREKNIIIQAYSPLTQGKQLDNPTLNQIADSHGKSPAQIMIRWSIQNGTVPLPKANQKHHLEENINVFDFELSEEKMQRLNDLCDKYSSFGAPLPYL